MTIKEQLKRITDKAFVHYCKHQTDTAYERFMRLQDALNYAIDMEYMDKVHRRIK